MHGFWRQLDATLPPPNNVSFRFNSMIPGWRTHLISKTHQLLSIVFPKLVNFAGSDLQILSFSRFSGSQAIQMGRRLASPAPLQGAGELANFKPVHHELPTPVLLLSGPSSTSAIVRDINHRQSCITQSALTSRENLPNFFFSNTPNRDFLHPRT